MELFVAADQSTKSKRAIKNKNKRKKLVEGSNASFTATKDEMRKERKMKKKPKLQAEDTETGMTKMCADQSIPKATKSNDRKRMKTDRKNEGDEKVEKKQMNNSLITDARFAWAQLDPRFQRMPKREAKVPVDSRFARLLSDRNFSSSSAPVDKRGKVRKSKEFNPLLNYYFHEKEPEVGKGEDDDEVEREKTEEENANTASTSSDWHTDESSSTTDEEDDDDDNFVNNDLCQFLMANHENTTTIEQETHRLAIVNMDWVHIKAVDLYVVLNSFLPKGGHIMSVTIYPTEFGLKCMEIEALRGPTSLIDDDGEKSEEEPDPEVINEKLRAYELNKLRYFYAVAVFDSSATANYVYNTLDGTELTWTSNVFDLRFIPDSMEFKHPPRDHTTTAPTNYMQPDFQTRALQLNKVNLTWEDDEPQRVKTLRRKFNAEKLDDLNEYLASSDDSDDEHIDAEKLRSLLDPNNNSNTDQSDNDKNMEITFNTGLEDLSKRILEKRDKKTETVWEQVLRKRSEKKKARKNWSKNSSDDEDSDFDVKVAHKQPDDFFVEETTGADFDSANNITKISRDRMKSKKVREHPQEIEIEQEASRAELELLFAEDQEIGKGPKGYNIKSKKTMGKKVKEMADEKLPNVDYTNDPRFSALYNNHLYALDPTDPHYKRSAAFARQRIQEQIGSKKTDKEDESLETDLAKKPDASFHGEKHELSSMIRSLKRNIENMKK